MGVAETILDAVDILMDKKVSELQFNKTVRAKIAEVLDPSIGKYKVQYQNGYFTAYASDSNLRYQRGVEVYVEILSNDFEKNALIVGTVQKLGSNYISIIEKLDRYTAVGARLDYKNEFSFKSYGGSQTKSILIDNVNWAIDGQTLDDINTLAQNVAQAAAHADAIKIGVTVKNNLPSEQRTQGNFGIKITTKYYDAADVTRSTFVARVYQFDINDMTGEPYKYVIPVKQYGIFNIDKENFHSIISIEAFCNNFLITKANQPDDIWFSDIHLQFLSEISESELQNSSLRIITPQGNFFTSSDQTKLLRADLRVKGKRVDYNSQNLDFYWFSEDVSIASDSKYFSAYGGNGWKLLNTLSSRVYETQINSNNYPGAETRFKCVAVFNDNGTRVSLSDILIFKRVSGAAFQITSSAGTIFAFNTGKTVLTVSGNLNTNDKFQWARQIGSEPLEILNEETAKNLEVKIDAAAAPNVVYRCSIFTTSGTLRATPSITLYNNKEQNGCTLVIKNATQIFKYDMYGTSPASEATAAADRIIIPALSFEIYDRQGSLIEIGDYTKAIDKIRWIWPAPYSTDSKAIYQTMLKPSAVSPVTMIQKMNLTTGIAYPVFGLEDRSSFIYGIRDVYNAELANTEKARNNIILEVDYQGEHLVASTDFTFTKDGELGTNGTKYYARITPAAGYDELYIRSGALRYIKNGKIPTDNILVSTSNVPITNAFDAQLWDGGSEPIWRASREDSSGTKVDWSIAKTTTRSVIPYLTISGKNVRINTNGNATRTILQATITYQGKKFYATYPIMYTTASSDSFPYIQNGYREVMYESDGSRGKFNGLPFRAAWIDSNSIHEPSYEVTVGSWGKSPEFGAVKKVDNTDYDYTIEPPSYYIGESSGHYIFLKLNNIYTYLPIELYLNRYGMSAMNDWDGNSIQVNSNGGYILAPQIGAGRKNDDNSFTGITIGEVFQDVNNKEIGMFGYYKGQRSLFLDAETGDAEFGVASEGQIKIRASDGQGTISDGHYHYDHIGGTGKGMKIKFTSTAKDPSDPDDEQGPYIKYGTGNFMVNANGHITAQGGGKIAGWQISDTYLRSIDTKTVLYSQNGPNMQLDTTSSDEAYKDKDGTSIKWNTQKQTRFSIGNQFQINEDGAFKSSAGVIGGWRIGFDRLTSRDNKTTLLSTAGDSQERINIGNGKFIIYGDGRFQAANNKFSVTADGVITATSGTIGGFTIEDHKLYADTEKLVLKDDGSIYGPGADYNFTPSKRVWEITPDGYAYFTDVKIRNNNAAEHGGNYDNNYFTWVGKETVSGVTTYPNIFTLTDSGSKIGGWNITGNELNSGGVHINSSAAGTSNAVLSVNEAFQIYGNGSFSASGGGSMGGCSVGAGGGGGITMGNSGLQDGILILNGHKLTCEPLSLLTGQEWELETTDWTYNGATESTSTSATFKGSDSTGATIYCSGDVTIPRLDFTLHLERYKIKRKKSVGVTLNSVYEIGSIQPWEA